MRHPATWLIVLAAVAFGLLLIPVFQPGGQPSAPGTDLPWQVHRDDEDRVQVFGLTLGRSTLRDAVTKLGRRYEIGLFRAADGTVTAEAYFKEAELGGLTAKLVLGLALDPALAAGIVARAGEGAPQPSNTWQYTPAATDEPTLLGAVVTAITYVPAARLDEALVRQRFGEPHERLADPARGTHWLYPERSLDLFLGSDGKAVLQYVLPVDYGRLRAAAASAPAEARTP